MKLDELKEHCLKTLKQTAKFPTKTFEEHALVLLLIENQTSVIAELEKIKAEIEEMKGDGLPYNASDYLYGRYQALDIVDDILQDRIAELKGENNE